MFRETSPILFHATRKRSYFKKVTILIPMTWTNTSIDRLANSEVYEVRTDHIYTDEYFVLKLNCFDTTWDHISH